MKSAIVRYQPMLIASFHALSILLLGVFYTLSLDAIAVIELTFVLGVSHVLARFIQQTLSPLLHYYRSQGHFAVIHRLGGMSVLIVIDIVVVMAGSLWLLSTLLEDMSVVSFISYGAIIFLTSLIKILQPFVQADATEEIQTLALVRRIGVAGVLLVGIVLVLQNLDLRLLAPLLAILQMVLFIQLIRLRQQYHKEMTYRRQYEDSGHQESWVQLFKTMSLQAISLLPGVIVQMVALTILLFTPMLFEFVAQAVPETLASSLLIILITALIVRFVFHFITPSPMIIRQAEDTNNQSRLTKEATLWLERGALLEVLMVIILASLFGVIVPIAIELDILLISFSLFLGYLLGIQAYLSHVFQRLSMIASSIINVTAITLILGGSFYYSVYFGYLGLFGSAILTMLYLYSVSYVWALKEYAIELKPHGQQLLKIGGLLGLGLGILVLLSIVLPEVIGGLRIPLQLLAMSSIILLVEMVIIYAYVRVVGLFSYTLDAHQLKQQFDTIYLQLQEEESIW